MSNIIIYENIENKIITIADQKVIIDSDVADLYGVTTKQVNQAITRNLEKFPEGYVLDLSKNEKLELVTNCDRFSTLKHSTVFPKAITEKGLYMLATILKSAKATETTIAIIETFAKIKELNKAISTLQTIPENTQKHKTLLQKTGELMADLMVPDEDDLKLAESETTLEIGFPFIRIKKTIRKKR